MVSKILYTELTFNLEFEAPVFFDIYPSFALRSVLGKSLREMHCICRGDQCIDCPFNKKCAFAFIFETPIEKESSSLQGRDRAGHPFRIIGTGQPGQTSRFLSFRIQLFGNGIDYIPHVVFAFREAGKTGLFRQRALYRVSGVACNDQDIFSGDRIKPVEVARQAVAIDVASRVPENRSLEVVCNTPLRFKTRGKYSLDFQAGDFFEACARRVWMLLEFFGEAGGSPGRYASNQGDLPRSGLDFHDRRLRWMEYVHWSARQKAKVVLGGYVGGFSVQGTAPSFFWQALRVCGALGAGKSTSFGFGDISIRETSISGE